MSILPYGEVSVFGWTSAYGLSVVLHGAAGFGILGGFGGWMIPAPEPPDSAPFMISFAPLETAPVEPVDLPPDPVEETPTALEPETVAPTLSETEMIQPVAPGAQEADVVTSAVEMAEPRPMLPLGPDAGGGDGAGVAVPEPTAAATEQDLALADWIERLKASAPPACLAALLRREGETGIGLAFVASDQQAMADYGETVLNKDGLQPTISRVLVDPRQCPALDFLRAHADYPATRLGLSLETPVVQSGERMTGFVRGAAGRQLTLLLVDDNGVVQDLNRFLSFSGNLARFEVPVTRDGPPRATGQILIAIATRGQPAELTARVGQLAEDVFVGLPRDLSESALLALATVEVR